MKNNNTPFAFLLSVLFVVALVGCEKDLELSNPEWSETQSIEYVEAQKPDSIENPQVLLSDCFCGVVLESRISTNHEGEKYLNVKAENYCTGRVFGFNYCVNESNDEIPEVGSTYCRDEPWYIR